MKGIPPFEANTDQWQYKFAKICAVYIAVSWQILQAININRRVMIDASFDKQIQSALNTQCPSVDVPPPKGLEYKHLSKHYNYISIHYLRQSHLPERKHD
jgi:hypothetical protein